VDVPDNIEGLDMTINIHLLDAPDELKEHTIQELSEYYIGYLSELVDEAKRVFI